MSRKEYGRGEPGARKKRVYPSRAKTPAGKKRALIRAKTREAQERGKLEKLERQRRAEIKEAKARGEKPLRPKKSVIGQAIQITRRAVRWVEEQVKALVSAITGNPEQEFYDFTHGSIARDHLRRLHDKREEMTTMTGERISGRIEEYLERDTIPWILSVIDVGAEQLRGHEIWNVTVFLFSEGKDQIGSPKPMEGVGKYQATFEAGGMASSYQEARAKLERQFHTIVESATGLLYVLYYVLFTRARNEA